MEGHMEVLVSIYGKDIIHTVLHSDNLWLRIVDINDVFEAIETYLIFSKSSN